MSSLRVLRWRFSWAQEREKSEEMGEIIMRNRDFRGFECELIYHPRYGRYESWSGGQQHQYVVIWTQSGKSYPWFFRSARILHIIHVFIPHLSLSCPQLYHHWKNTKLSYALLSLHAMIMSQHQVQHTPSAEYTGYSIHLGLSVVPLFSRFWVDPWM